MSSMFFRKEKRASRGEEEGDEEEKESERKTENGEDDETEDFGVFAAHNTIIRFEERVSSSYSSQSSSSSSRRSSRSLCASSDPSLSSLSSQSPQSSSHRNNTTSTKQFSYPRTITTGQRFYVDPLVCSEACTETGTNRTPTMDCDESEEEMDCTENGTIGLTETDMTSQLSSMKANTIIERESGVNTANIEHERVHSDSLTSPTNVLSTDEPQNSSAVNRPGEHCDPNEKRTACAPQATMDVEAEKKGKKLRTVGRLIKARTMSLSSKLKKSMPKNTKKQQSAKKSDHGTE